MKIFTRLMVICSILWATSEATQYHSCPPLDSDVAGICSEECSRDEPCQGNQICCSNGCGHTCVNPVPIPYNSPHTVCPPVDDDMAGTCEERCTNNSDCSAGELCCSNGCGHVCTAQMSACSAVHQQISNQSLLGSYLPQCEEDGSFSRAQCHSSTGYCWCVEPERGQPVSDVVRFKTPQCNCTYDDDVHFVGETFAAGDGCNTCTCTVDGEVKCTDINIPCPGQEEFYSCPAVREDTAGICEHECSLHSECTHSRKCCYNGCGHTCTPPVTIPYVPLPEAIGCPSADDVPCVDGEEERVGSCRDPEFACGEGEVCCDNGCSSAVCLGRSELTPCFTAREILEGNGTRPALLGAYRPQCDEDGHFRHIQCHEHFCWCVESLTGKPLSDIVPIENSDALECSECVYNGRVYHHRDTFPSGDGCNQCSCVGGSIACTEMACTPTVDDDEDNDLWEWWHTVLIVCIVVVAVLGVIVAALIAGVFILMKQNGQYRHKKLKEVTSPKFEPEAVQFRTGQDSIELKVPVEDDEEHKPAHA